MILEELLKTSVSSVLIIAAVLIIRRASINKASKRTFVFLWGIITLRLLFPMSLPSEFGLSSAVKIFPQGILEFVGSAFESGAEMHGQNPELPSGGSDGEYAEGFQGAPDYVYDRDSASQIQPNAAVKESSDKPFDAVYVLTVIWAAGFLISAASFAVSHLKNRRDYRAAIPVDDDTEILLAGKSRGYILTVRI